MRFAERDRKLMPIAPTAGTCHRLIGGSDASLRRLFDAEPALPFRQVDRCPLVEFPARHVAKALALCADVAFDPTRHAGLFEGGGVGLDGGLLAAL
jgi:hypothetical protein